MDVVKDRQRSQGDFQLYVGVDDELTALLPEADDVPSEFRAIAVDVELELFSIGGLP